LGVITLSYLTLTSEKFQKSALDISVQLFEILIVTLPFGSALGGLIALFNGFPSSKTAIIIGIYLMPLGVLSRFFVETFVSQPRFKFASTTSKRIVFIGGYFVIIGLIAQLAGATLDLVNFNG
jgi:hypothetical protein